jgi:hypothetical protein
MTEKRLKEISVVRKYQGNESVEESQSGSHHVRETTRSLALIVAAALIAVPRIVAVPGDARTAIDVDDIGIRVRVALSALRSSASSRGVLNKLLDRG